MNNAEILPKENGVLSELKRQFVHHSAVRLFDLNKPTEGYSLIYDAFVPGDRGRDNVATLNDLVRTFGNMSVRDINYCESDRESGIGQSHYDLCLQPGPGMTQAEFADEVLRLKDTLVNVDDRKALLTSVNWTDWYFKYRASGLLNEDGEVEDTGPYILPQLVDALTDLYRQLSTEITR